MVQEFTYQAETFEICVDGKTYPVSTSKLFLIQRMQQLCDETSKSESPDIIGFVEKIYDILKKILGEDVFNSIFAGKEYDVVFMSEFCCYLSEMASPQMKSVADRLAKITQKYSKDNLNEPADPQTTDNG